jgi:hypothetical protein
MASAFLLSSLQSVCYTKSFVRAGLEPAVSSISTEGTLCTPLFRPVAAR